MAWIGFVRGFECVANLMIPPPLLDRLPTGLLTRMTREFCVYVVWHLERRSCMWHACHGLRRFLLALLLLFLRLLYPLGLGNVCGSQPSIDEVAGSTAMLPLHIGVCTRYVCTRYVCMYVCIYVCMYIHIYICIYAGN